MWKVSILYGVFLQISELSVDVESKQKELQRLQQDKGSVEEQLSSLVRPCQSIFQQEKKRKKIVSSQLTPHMFICFTVGVGLNKGFSSNHEPC